MPLKHKTSRNKCIRNIGFKSEILYRFQKFNIAQHFYIYFILIVYSICLLSLLIHAIENLGNENCNTAVKPTRSEVLYQWDMNIENNDIYSKKHKLSHFGELYCTMTKVSPEHSLGERGTAPNGDLLRSLPTRTPP